MKTYHGSRSNGTAFILITENTYLRGCCIVAATVVALTLIQGCSPSDSGAHSEITKTAKGLSQRNEQRNQQLQMHYRNAEVAMKRGEYSAAIAIYVGLEELQPESLFRLACLARAYDRSGRSADAYQTWQKVMRPKNGSVSSDQSDARVLARFGELCEQFDNRQAAMSAYKRAIADSHSTFPKGIKVVAQNTDLRSLRHAALFASIEAHRAVGKDDLALLELEKLNELRPHDPLTKAALAFQYLRFGERVKANALFDEALRLSHGIDQANIAALKSRFGAVPTASAQAQRIGSS